MNKYNIYVVNNMTSTQEFWCFLAAPQTNYTGSVYANSSAYVGVVPNSPSLNFFTVPVQYVFQAGASNNAVGLNIEITSTTSNNVNLGDQWEAAFADPQLHQGATLTKYGSLAPAASLQYETNNYDQAQEPVNHWFASETFGIETESGFIGVTWAPIAGATNTITPNLQFYIATGSYSANTLANMTTVSTQSQVVNLTDFDNAFNCTVTLSSSGLWSVAPGTPPLQQTADMSMLVESHFLLARAHDSLVASGCGANAERYLESMGE